MSTRTHSLLLRFLRVFFKKFLETMWDGYFDKLIVFLTVLYFVGQGIFADKWEVIAPLVWGVCAIIVGHGFAAAREVSKEIQEAITKGHPKGFAPDTPVAYPLLYRTRLYAIAGLLLGASGYVSYRVWDASKEQAANRESHKDAVTITQGTVWQADDFFHGTFFVRFNATKNITPINVMADYAITNVKGTPIMIKSLSLELLGKHNTWWTLVNLPTTQPIWNGNPSIPNSGVGLLVLPEGFLMDKIANVELPKGASLRGWMLCQIPPDYLAIGGSDSAPLRLRVVDTAGDETVQPLEKPTVGVNVLFTEMKSFPVPNEDLASYAVIAYGSQ